MLKSLIISLVKTLQKSKDYFSSHGRLGKDAFLQKQEYL